MNTEPVVGVPTPSQAHPDTGKKGLIITVGVLAVLAVGALLYFTIGHKGSGLPQPESFVLFENDTYTWYELSGTKVAPGGAPVGAEPSTAVFPDGHTVGLTIRGLEWEAAAKKKSQVLVDRKGLTADTSALASDGSTAVLYNDVTNALDVFKLTYEGANVSYVGSIPMPALPSYLVAVGVVAPNTVVVRIGNPESFLLYRVGQTVESAGTASLATPQ